MKHDYHPRTGRKDRMPSDTAASSLKHTHMKYTFTMKRTYETVIEVDADDYDEAIVKLSKADVYATELEQCSVIEETFEHNGKPVKSITTII